LPTETRVRNLGSEHGILEDFEVRYGDVAALLSTLVGLAHDAQDDGRTFEGVISITDQVFALIAEDLITTNESADSPKVLVATPPHRASVCMGFYTDTYVTKCLYNGSVKIPRQPRGVKEGEEFSASANPELTLALAPKDSSWPSITYEERRLDYVDEELEAYGSNRNRKLSKGPYRAAITPEIADIPSIDVPSDVAALAAEASVEIARFDQEIGSEFANFTSILLRSESASSSQIENLTAGAKAIALAEIGDASKRNASMIVANTTAMNRALELADRLDEESIISMHEALLRDTNPEWTGHWRTDQVRIVGASVHNARFVPPHQDRVPAAMTDLVQFVHRLDVPTFEMAAVAHAQFETIHPFPDGNGRVGRALIHAIFKNRELTHSVTVPVSAGLLSETGAYFDSLNDYRSGNPVTIIELMASASFAAIDNGRNLAADLHGYEEDWHGRLKVRSDSSAWKVVDLVLRHPAIDSSLVQRELFVAQRVADRSISQLADVGILTEVSGYKRNRRWVATEVVSALDAFAKRAGRRRAR